MTGMDGFRIELELGSPLALGALPFCPTLDSVLLSLLAGGGPPGESDEEVLLTELGSILRVEDGVPAASALWPERELLRSWALHPRAPSRDEIAYWRKAGQGASYNPNRGWSKAQMIECQLGYAQKWFWWGEGDMDGVAKVLSGLCSVGGKRGLGYGAVMAMTIRRAPAGSWQLAYDGPDLRIGRPVPLDRLDSVLAVAQVTRSELSPTHYAIVAMPRWPRPAWGGGGMQGEVPTMVPLL